MAESNLPTTGEELEVKNEFPATGEEKQQGKDFVIVILYCLLIRYILILMHNFLDHFDSKALSYPVNTLVLAKTRRL